MGQAIDFMKIERMVQAAYSLPTTTVSALIPYLEARQIAAQRYVNTSGVDIKTRGQLLELIHYYNHSISEILGFEIKDPTKE